jgi:hypothetical protein
MKLTGEDRSTGIKTSPSATLSTTNSTWTNPGLRGERPATTRLSHVTAFPRTYSTGPQRAEKPAQQNAKHISEHFLTHPRINSIDPQHFTIDSCR